MAMELTRGLAYCNEQKANSKAFDEGFDQIVWDKDSKLKRAQRMIRDARRGKGKYTIDDYEWLIEELEVCLKSKLEEIGKETSNHPGSMFKHFRVKARL